MGIQVLIADDHQMLREFLRRILGSEEDIEVVGEASDGQTAVEMARTLAPDVVIMDIGLPGLDGISATRQIRVENPKIKVMALSVHSERPYVQGMLDAGASGYVLKAAGYRELRRAVQAVSQGGSYLSPDIAGVAVDARARTPPELDAPVRGVLGPREREVVQLLAEGHTSPQIARALDISTSTVDTHRRNIMRKLDLHSVAELTKYAIHEGLTSPEV